MALLRAADQEAFEMTSLYVGNLDASVTETPLYDHFSEIGKVCSLRVCRDSATNRSLGYAYVNYANPQTAADAIRLFNFTDLNKLNGKPVRILYSNPDPSIRRSGVANVYVKNLHPSVDSKTLHDHFSAAYGAILSCQVATNADGESKGYGYVQFEEEESAQNAINSNAYGNGMILHGKQVSVVPFKRKGERSPSDAKNYTIANAADKTKFTNVYVKNFTESTTEEDLRRVFGEIGAITSAAVMRDAEGKSKCFGFVNFESAEHAAMAVKILNGKKIDNIDHDIHCEAAESSTDSISDSNREHFWYVARAQKKSERREELMRVKREQESSQRDLNVFVRNIDETVEESALKESFSQFGTVTSCKLIKSSSDGLRSKSSCCFITFALPKQAKKAVREMNGKTVGRKKLHVVMAQNKEERQQQAKLKLLLHDRLQMMEQHQSWRSQMQVPMFYTASTARHLQPFMYVPLEAAHLNMVPAQIIGYDHQQHMPTINYLMHAPAAASAGFQRQLTVGTAITHQTAKAPLHQISNSNNNRPSYNRTPLIQQSSSQVVRVQSNSKDSVASSSSSKSNSKDSVASSSSPKSNSKDSVASSSSSKSNSKDSGAAYSSNSSMAKAIAFSDSEQLVTLGERLYPLVDKLEHDRAGKVTGMLLELSQSEILHLIESPQMLEARILEAMDVLREHAEAEAP